MKTANENFHERLLELLEKLSTPYTPSLLPCNGELHIHCVIEGDTDDFRC